MTYGILIIEWKDEKVKKIIEDLYNNNKDSINGIQYLDGIGESKPGAEITITL